VLPSTGGSAQAAAHSQCRAGGGHCSGADHGRAGVSGLRSALNCPQTARQGEREAAVNESLVLASSAQQQLENGYTELALALALRAADMDQPPATLSAF